MLAKGNALLLAGVLATCAGTIYKWVDEKGVTHYSESPPPEQKAQPLAPPAAPAVQTDRDAKTTKSWQEQEEEFRKRHQARKERVEREFEERQFALAWKEFLNSIPVPGRTGASAALQRNVLLGLQVASVPGCYRYRITDTVVVEVNQATKRAVERWSFDACGKLTQFEMIFTPGGPGRGSNVAMRRLGQ